MERSDRDNGLCVILCGLENAMNTELTIQQIEQALTNLPNAIEKAGQELVTAENLLSMAQVQLDIDMARERIKHIGEDISAKTVESYAISLTEAQMKQVVELEMTVSVKKLAKETLENKFSSARKIANIRNIYQPM